MSRRLTYFVSDTHLGLRVGDPLRREADFVAFLRSIDTPETEALYLLGDIWDFWYEYRDVVPKGFVRVFGALAGLMDHGVQVFFFRGNHDLWSYRYFEELGMMPLAQPQAVRIGPKRFCLGHGDGLGPGNHWYKFVKGVFSRRLPQRLFSALHPWFAFRLGTGWSRKSRGRKAIAYRFKGADEPLYRFCEDFLSREPVDCFIFGHYHSPSDLSVGEARLLILGDWMTAPNWIVYDREADTLDFQRK